MHLYSPLLTSLSSGMPSSLKRLWCPSYSKQDNCYISTAGNAGTQSLSRGLEVAILPLDHHSLAQNEVAGLLASFKILHKQDWTETRELEQTECFNYFEYICYEGEQDLNVATVIFVKILGIINRIFKPII
jgi:hypothetical protein